jgi:dodecin
MSIAKVIEIMAESENSFDEAVENGVAGAIETLSQVRSAWVKDQEVVIEDDEIQAYRVTLKVTFVVERSEEGEEEEEEEGVLS